MIEPQVLAAVIGALGIVAGAGITSVFASRSLTKRIGKANGKGPALEILERIEDLMGPLVESQYEVLTRIGNVEGRQSDLEVRWNAFSHGSVESPSSSLQRSPRQPTR